MKNLFIIFTLIICLVSCAGNGQRQVTSENYGNYQVQKLFTVDSITVYRFSDGGHFHYFTNRKGSTIVTYSNGKTTYSSEIECE